MLFSNLFGKNEENSSQESNESTADSLFNINDPIVRAFGSRDLPFTLKDNASIQDMYQAVINLFSIKKCYLGIGSNLVQNQLDKIVSNYPLIEYELIKPEPNLNLRDEDRDIIEIDDS